MVCGTCAFGEHMSAENTVMHGGGGGREGDLKMIWVPGLVIQK